VLSASVTVDKQLISSVGKGILVFAAVATGDTEQDADALAAKVLKMRLWDDEAGARVCEKPLYNIFNARMKSLIS
jgi:D-tyrosyl-tRNA(Tyr) deacylase